MPDHLEDLDRDGVVDAGETNPRVPGLFPGRYPHIPEPMVFDLVRALSARKGEIEFNTLAQVRFRRGEGATVEWAPEIEWAIIDGLSVELEVPIHGRDVEGLKFAMQGSLPEAWRRFGHGIQVIGEYRFSDHGAVFSALYLAGVRLARWSLFSMFGVRGRRPFDSAEHYEALINPSVFVDLHEQVTIGVETNHAIDGRRAYRGAIIPQVHWQIAKRFRIQVGGGVGIDGGRAHPLVGVRAVIE